MPAKLLFDEAALRKLSRLTFIASQIRTGVMKGERRSTRRGVSLEFTDYRNYTPGDDLRRLDWNVYARLEKPFIKLFQEEEDLAVHILIDSSRSMDWGEGEAHKFRYALHLAAALGAVALGSGDQLDISSLFAAAALPLVGPLRGKRNTLRLLHELERAGTAGETHLAQALRSYAIGSHRPGLLFVISDLLSAEDFMPGLKELQARGHELVLVHLLSPEELDPPLAGDLRLVDVETGNIQEVSVDGGMRDLYRDRLEAWRGELAAACRRRSIRFLSLSTSLPWDEVVLQEMRAAGVVK